MSGRASTSYVHVNEARDPAATAAESTAAADGPFKV